MVKPLKMPKPTKLVYTVKDQSPELNEAIISDVMKEYFAQFTEKQRSGLEPLGPNQSPYIRITTTISTISRGDVKQTSYDRPFNNLDILRMILKHPMSAANNEIVSVDINPSNRGSSLTKCKEIIANDVDVMNTGAWEPIADAMIPCIPVIGPIEYIRIPSPRHFKRSLLDNKYDFDAFMKLVHDMDQIEPDIAENTYQYEGKVLSRANAIKYIEAVPIAKLCTHKDTLLDDPTIDDLTKTNLRLMIQSKCSRTVRTGPFPSELDILL